MDRAMWQWPPKSVWALIAAILSSQAAANSLGLSPPDWWPESYFGRDLQINELGEIQFDWIDPVSNDYKTLSFQQTNVVSVPYEIQRLMAGNPVTCILTSETALVKHADCSVFLNDLEQGATSVVRLISAYNGDQVDCTPAERRAFAVAGLRGCDP